MIKNLKKYGEKIVEINGNIYALLPVEEYIHKKGKTYFSIGKAIHTETEEVFENYLNNEGRLFVRPYTMFHDGRFIKKDEVTPNKC